MKAVVALLLPGLAAAASAQQTYDRILTGGRIVDGTRNSWFYGDVAIRGNRIAKIAPPAMYGSKTYCPPKTPSAR